MRLLNKPTEWLRQSKQKFHNYFSSSSCNKPLGSVSSFSQSNDEFFDARASLASSRTSSFIFIERPSTTDSSFKETKLENHQKIQFELNEQRDFVLAHRIRLRQKRNELEIAANKASDQRVYLISTIRDCFENQLRLDELECRVLYQKVIAAQDAFGVLEADYLDALGEYNKHEEDFNSKEWIATHKRLEYPLVSAVRPLGSRVPSQDRPQTVVEARTPEPSSIPPPPQLSLLQSANKKNANDPRHAYLQCVGKVDMLQERLVGLQIEQAELEEMELSVHQARKPDPEDVDQVKEFLAMTQKELQEALINLEKAFRKFREEAQPEDEDLRAYDRIMHPGSHPLPHDFIASQNFDNEDTKEDDLDDTSRDERSELSSGFEDIGKRIDKWIIDGLEKSNLEQARLRSYLQNKIKPREEWRFLVLNFSEARQNAKVDKSESAIIRKTALRSKPSIETLVRRVEISYADRSEEKIPQYKPISPGDEEIKFYYESYLEINLEMTEVVHKTLAEEDNLQPLAWTMSFIGCWMQ